MVMFPSEIRIPRSLRKASRAANFEVTADKAFPQVIAACRLPRGGQAGTWITEQMVTAYIELHRAGHAHSIETWVNGVLAGGLYGMAIGRAFFGESMFTRVDNASKVALTVLARQLAAWDFGIIDCQMRTDHLAMFGAREIPRVEFAQKLNELVKYDDISVPWEIEIDTAL